MDLSVLFTDEIRPAAALTDGQTGDLESLLLSSTVNTHESEAETVSYPSEPTDKYTLNISTCLSQETSTDSDRCKMSRCLGSSAPALPVFSSQSKTFYIQQKAPAECPMEPSSSEASFTSEHSQVVSLLRPLSPQSDSLDSDAAVAPLSDLNIFEYDTQDFILKPDLDPYEIKSPEWEPLLETGVEKTNYDFDTQVLPCESEDIVTQCHHSSSEEINESDMSQHTQLRPPAADAWAVSLMVIKEVSSEDISLTPQLQGSESPVDLWLDACQYLSGETQVSDNNPEDSEGIGWYSSDTRGWGQPVERWPSVDSWASALSDWTGILAAPPEDITAAFTEAGAEIDALTQALAEVTHRGPHLESTEQLLMGVQDHLIKAQSPPDSSLHSGHSCLSLCLDAAGPDREASQRLKSVCDPMLTTQGELSSIPQHSTGATVASPGRQDTCPELDLFQFGGCVESLETDFSISNEEEPIILKIIEDSDLNSPAELVTEEPFGDGVCKVTDEHIVPQLGSVAEQEATQSCECDGISLTNTIQSHVPGVDVEPGLHFDVHTYTSLDTPPDLDGACQVLPHWESPKFIMPLAPLGIGSSLVTRTNSSLEGDQTFAKRFLNDNRDLIYDHVQHHTLWPNPDGITGKPSLEGDEEVIHQRRDTNTAEESTAEDVHRGDTAQCVLAAGKTLLEEINDLSRENFIGVPADHFIISETNRVAYVTLDLNDPFVSRPAKPRSFDTMPHKTHKNTSESKSHSRKDKSAGHHHGGQASKKQESASQHVACRQQETHPTTAENHASKDTPARLEAKETNIVTEAPSKPHGKKKKKHGQNTTSVKSVGEPLKEVENGAKPMTAKGKVDEFEVKLGAKAGKAQKDNNQSEGAEKKPQHPEGEQHPPPHTDQPRPFTSPLKDEVIKRPRLSQDKFGKIVSTLEAKLPKSDVSIKANREEVKADVGTARRKAYSEVVKQKIPPKEDPKVVQPIQAVSVSGDPQSLCLWCQFAAVFSDYTVTWSREGSTLAEIKRSAGDESRVSLTITAASHKDLGKYQCRLSSLHGSVTLEYLLTYEVLSEVVIPPKTVLSARVEVSSEEEGVNCSRLMFKEDFLSDQYFEENHPISIVVEKVHFGEGMHRRAFRSRLEAGQMHLLVPGHSCVLKVHNAISNGTKNNDDLVQKNFTLAVEECQVQNTAREYIKAYTAAAQSVEAFGDVPEIIPIYLVHRPSNDIPYATLEEELIGDFVKYSVKDGKELNLMRRDSEAGQKCCSFQHWVYHKTEGNLLVTDMQGVGMKLTDVGIATCKKGYKGFKGNCATSFIDQFKALHQCNQYCEILGLKSLQPKPKKPATAPKAKPQPSAAPKKKTFGPAVKGKS
ncbi:alpha-protein kinase 2 isoform X2 [Parambassis ranga]|uniref:non-specific serine/threonine protein kinase n=1 Tax=Parambassis ranga TaxID=210632 RepID=A0A6P7JAV4_9TELE|nr:alpha-protein kinase 2 isoform X2 [Parambassis ranga]